MPHIVGPDIVISEPTEVTDDDDDDHDGYDDQENELRRRLLKDAVAVPSAAECDSKRSSGVEPTLDPSKVLTALVANNNGQLPPYQL